MRHRLPALIVGLTVALGWVGLPTRGEAAGKVKTGSQIEFGVDMARRGLWSEALFRFQRASVERPNDPRVLNNIAVAYEALGLFEKALEAYQQALDVSPGNRELRANYSRFLEFYQSFKPDEPETDTPETGAAEGEPADG